ncbi:MAG: LptE family protein, partial [Muribaculaceae bacterium]|nr:LptE family protein [Muribaculaceae bacterium]
IARNTRLQVKDGASDLQIEGEITGYNLSPQAVTEDAYASRTRLTITVRVKYTDNRQESNNIDQTFSAYRDFDSSEMLTDVQDELCLQISKELVDLIFNATLGNW